MPEKYGRMKAFCGKKRKYEKDLLNIGLHCSCFPVNFNEIYQNSFFVDNISKRPLLKIMLYKGNLEHIFDLEIRCREYIKILLFNVAPDIKKGNRSVFRTLPTSKMEHFRKIVNGL